MTKIKKRFLLFVLLVIILAVGWFLFAGKPSVDLEYNWRPGCKQSYTISLKSLTHYAQPDLKEIILRQEIDAILNINVLDLNDQDVFSAIQLSEVRARYNGEEDPGLNRLYQLPFLLVMDRNGRLISVTLPNAISEQDGAVLQGIVESLEVVVPLNVGKEWEVEQTHSTGSYIAGYNFDSKEGKIIKRKKRYTHLDSESFPPDSIAAIRDSRFQVRLSNAPQCWIGFFGGRERLQISGSGGSVKFEMTLTLEPVVGEIDNDLHLWNVVSYEEMRKNLLKGKKNSTSRANQERIERIAEELKGENEVLSGLIEKYAKDMSSADMMALKDQISDYLLAFPEQLEVFSAMLRDPATDREKHGFLIYVLQMTASNEAQQLLAELAEDPTQVKENRIRAISAAAFVEEPAPELVQAIWQLSQQSDDKEIADTAILSYGATARRLQKNDPTSTAKIHQNLSGEFQNALKAGETQRAAQLLLALGNTAYPGIVQDVESGLANSDPTIRAAAAEALGEIEDGFATKLLEQQIMIEEEGPVLAQLYKGLLKREFSQEAAQHAKSSLSSEQDDGARLAMVDYLVKHRQNDLEIQDVLDQQRKVETNSLIYGRIIQGLH